MTIYRPLFVWPVYDQLRADAQTAPGWVFTDRPFYAFQAGLPVPPTMAVISRKRLESGIITQEMIVDALKQYRPRYVLLERFTYSYGPSIIDRINRNFDQVLDIDPARYYRLKPGERADPPY